MVALVSRTGRHLQRYNKGCRQVVGCIPYRLKITDQGPSQEEVQVLEVLLISSQKGTAMLFPKGGWETDESKTEAAARETVEEAGVLGIIESELGKWSFKSKRHDTYSEAFMFPLLVEEELEQWPEKEVRERKWMSAGEARDKCKYWWMKEALDRLVRRLTFLRQQKEEFGLGLCPPTPEPISNL